MPAEFPDGPETVLPPGDVTVGVVRVENTVRRPHQGSSVRVAQYLRHLERAGFDRAPRYLGRDVRGRDVLTFLDGDVPSSPIPMWATADAVLPGVGRLLRRLHDASVGFTAAPVVQPQRPAPRLPSDEPLIYSQRDLTPQNTVFRAGQPWGVIDFDLCDWTTRSVDLANTAMHWVPLCDPVDLPDAYGDRTNVDPDAAGRRLRLLLDGYGRDAVSPGQLLEAARLRFVDSYAAMQWAAHTLGGGWKRMWDDGVGEVINRRIAWLTEARADLARALTAP